MWHDVRVVFWKEWKALADQLGGDSRAGLWMVAALFVGLSTFAAFFAGPDWVESPLALVNYPLLAAAIAIQPIVDSFAGERERHTLETLLASRLSDRAIVVGKILAAVLPAFVAGLVLFALGIVVVNLNPDQSGPIVVPPRRLLWPTVALIGLLPLLVAGAGVLVSLRASTVRRAQQMLGFAIVGAMLIPFLVVMAAPEWLREEFITTVSSADPGRVVFVALSAAAVLAFTLQLIAISRFRRGRVPLD
jgi:ABC-2 type transport system permease protein